MIAVLEEICATKRKYISQQKEKNPLAHLEAMAKNQSKPKGFISAIQKAHAADRYGLICEIKKASPSKGIIRADFDPVSLAKSYQKGGATCLSVLTDEPYFQGSDQFLLHVKKAVTLPLLRKDFMLDPYQIIESRALGADCILLILAALDPYLASELEALALDLGMDVLIEVHDRDELERAKDMASPLVGINNRNLKTMKQDIATSLELAPYYAQNMIPVSESGLKTPAELSKLSAKGFNSFLIGETFMREENIVETVEKFQKSF